MYPSAGTALHHPWSLGVQTWFSFQPARFCCHRRPGCSVFWMSLRPVLITSHTLPSFFCGPLVVPAPSTAGWQTMQSILRLRIPGLGTGDTKGDRCKQTHEIVGFVLLYKDEPCADCFTGSPLFSTRKRRSHVQPHSLVFVICSNDPSAPQRWNVPGNTARNTDPFAWHLSAALAPLSTLCPGRKPPSRSRNRLVWAKWTASSMPPRLTVKPRSL